MRHLDELPLVAFTALAAMGAGILAAWPLRVVTLIDGDGVRDGRWAALLLGLSLAISLAHLGRAWRFPLAANGIGRSRLTHEVLLAVATFVAALALVWLLDGAPSRLEPWLRAVASVLASVFLLSVGFVYRIPTRPTWTGLAPAAPLVCGWLFGTVWHAAFAPLPIAAPALGLVLADSLLLAARWQALRRASGRPVHPHAYAQRGQVVLARFLLLDVATAALLAVDAHAAVVVAAAGITLDRLMFYVLVLERTIESDVGEVEAVIG